MTPPLYRRRARSSDADRRARPCIAAGRRTADRPAHSQCRPRDRPDMREERPRADRQPRTTRFARPTDRMSLDRLRPALAYAARSGGPTCMQASRLSRRAASCGPFVPRRHRRSATDFAHFRLAPNTRQPATSRTDSDTCAHLNGRKRHGHRMTPLRPLNETATNRAAQRIVGTDATEATPEPAADSGPPAPQVAQRARACEPVWDWRRSRLKSHPPHAAPSDPGNHPLIESP